MVDNRIIYVENPMESAKKLLYLISEFSNELLITTKNYLAQYINGVKVEELYSRRIHKRKLL